MTKSLDQFPPRRRGESRLQSWCRTCFAANNARYYVEHRDVQKARLLGNAARRRDENRRKAAEYLMAHPCVDCGETDLVVLDFDHVGAKTSAVSAMIANGVSSARIEAEIKKCDVRCANCHRIRTAESWIREELALQIPIDQVQKSRPRPQQLLLAEAMELRTCRVCGAAKLLLEFPVRSPSRQTRQWICLACQRIYSQAWYKRNRAHQIAAARKNNLRRRERAAIQVRAVRQQLACIGCGESNPLVLDFHHLGRKTADISTMVRSGLPSSRIEEELAKCEPLCANCHRRKTAEQQGWWKATAS
jgi:Zn finger protein HypA/HybF involved in hydrogenase expression